MAKFSIAWHEQCLANSRETYERSRHEVDGAVARLERDRIRIEMYEHQIKRAKELGKDGFDSEKFGKKRHKEKA